MQRDLAKASQHMLDLGRAGAGLVVKSLEYLSAASSTLLKLCNAVASMSGNLRSQIISVLLIFLLPCFNTSAILLLLFFTEPYEKAEIQKPGEDAQ